MPRIPENINFVHLVAGLILLLFAGALLEYFPGTAGPRIIQATTVAVLLIGAWSLKGNRSRFVAIIAFVLLMILVIASSSLLEKAGFGYLHLLMLLCFFIWVTCVVARKVLFTGSITGNEIVGAICIYMLLGLIWAMLYLLIAEVVPGAFNGLPHAPWLENISAAIYFSFVTITTLGYGDISPVLPLARFLVYMEAITGVFYMAVLVASLIGVRLSDRDAASK